MYSSYVLLSFLVRTPPAGLNMGLYLSFYTYDGDCNSAAAQAQIKQNMVWMGFCNGECSMNKLKSNCGQATIWVAQEKVQNTVRR